MQNTHGYTRVVSDLRGDISKAKKVYVPIRLAPGRSAWLPITKRQAINLIHNFGESEEVSCFVASDGDVWLGF